MSFKRWNTRGGKKRSREVRSTCGAEKGTGTQSRIHFTSLQKITAKKPFLVKSPEIFFVVGSKKKAAGIAPLKYPS